MVWGEAFGSPRGHDWHRSWVSLANFWTARAALSIIDAKKPEPKELRDWSWGSVTPLGRRIIIIIIVIITITITITITNY